MTVRCNGGAKPQRPTPLHYPCTGQSHLPSCPPTWTDREKNQDDFYYNLEPATTGFNLYADLGLEPSTTAATLYDVVLCIPTPSGPLSGQRRNEERWVVR